MTNIKILSVFILLLFSLLLFELPKALIDFFVLANIIFSIVILIKSLLSNKIAEIFSFPSMIVLASLFRLCLIVAISKLLLSYGDQGTDVAGKIVEAFGVYASGADPIVGIVIFLIIGLVNLLVISKGALRVAEVSARFTLDAIPGKQMAIDSDLRANLISADEASKRRKELNQESQFYASIDGAMKWVHGDALFTFVVAFMCLVLGVGLGYYRGLIFQDSLNTFGVLSIGAGLVNIIPSLFVSVSSGLLVSKVRSVDYGVGGSEEGSDSFDQIITQIFFDKKALLLICILTTALFLFSLLGILNMPFLPFLIFSLLSLLLYFKKPNKSIFNRDIFTGNIFNGGSNPALLKVENVSDSIKQLGHDGVIIELGKDLASYLESKDSKNENNYSKIKSYIETVKSDYFSNSGVKLPNVRFLMSENIEAKEFKILMAGNEIDRGLIYTDMVSLNCSNSIATSLGYEVIQTADNELSKNQVSYIKYSNDISASNYESLNKINIPVLRPYQVLANKILSGVITEIEKTFGIGESKKLINALSKDVREELFKDNKLSLAEYNEIIKALVKEGVSVKNFKLISESAIEFMALNEYDDDRKFYLNKMYNFIRKSISREIVKDCLSYGDKLRVILLSSDIEEAFESAISLCDDDKLIKTVSLSQEAGIRESFLRVIKPVLERGSTPIVVMCSSGIRSSVQNYISEIIGGIRVVRAVAYEEVGNKFKPEIIGTLNLT